MAELTREQRLLILLRDTRCGGNAAELARKLQKDPTYVNRLFYPVDKAGHKGIGLEVMRKASEVFELPAGFWEGAPPQTEQEAPSAKGGGGFSPVRPPTIEEVTERLAEMLQGLDEAGRDMVSTVLSNLAKNPGRATNAAQMIESIMALQARDPTPQPPRGGARKRKITAAERRGDARPQLTVTAGGGRKMQMDLALQKAIDPPRDPFNEDNAPANEKDWYPRVRNAPKAKDKA